MEAKHARKPAQQGFALAAALGLTAALGLVAGAVAAVARSDLLVTRNLAGSIRAYYLAEAGVLWSLAQIPPGWGTPDAPFRDQAEVAFPSSLSRFMVSTVRGSPPNGQLRLIASGWTRGGATRSLEASVRRSLQPSSPGALTVGGANPHVHVAGVLFVDGREHSPAYQTPPRGKPGPAYALTTPPGAGGEVSFSGRGRVWLGGRGEEPSLGRALPPDLSALSRMLAPLRQGVTRIAGPARLRTATALAGIVLVDGPLSVEAPLQVRGVLAVRGPLTVRRGKTTVVGALWLVPTPGASATLRIDGGGELDIRYSTSALETADSAATLPRWPVVVGLRESPEPS